MMRRAAIRRWPGSRTGAAALAIALAASGAGAGDAPLSAPEFDALTRGATFDTYSTDGRYGVETFLPGRRSVWQDARGCMAGTWEQVGDLICFTYEDDPANPDCWTYFTSGDGIIGYYQGDPGTSPITLRRASSGLTCDPYLGA